MSFNHLKTIRTKPTFRMLHGIMIGLVIWAVIGYAGTTNPLPPFPAEGTPFMTLQDHSNEKTVFGWDEKSFFYFLLPAVDSTRSFLLSTIWKYGGEVVTMQSDTYFHIYSLHCWKGLDHWTDPWVRKSGLWSVDTTWGYCGSKYALQSTRPFTVMPEPFSVALFLLGGLALSTREFFVKKA